MSAMTGLGTAWMLCLLGVVPALAAQQVFVVEATGLGDFTTLQAAVDAAGTGDVIIVQSTDMAASAVTVIDGKGLAGVGRIPTTHHGHHDHRGADAAVGAGFSDPQ